MVSEVFIYMIVGGIGVSIACFVGLVVALAVTPVTPEGSEE